MNDKVTIIVQSPHNLNDIDGRQLNQGASYTVKRSELINSYLEFGFATEAEEAEEDKSTPAKSPRKPLNPVSENSQENSDG